MRLSQPPNRARGQGHHMEKGRCPRAPREKEKAGQRVRDVLREEMCPEMK